MAHALLPPLDEADAQAMREVLAQTVFEIKEGVDDQPHSYSEKLK